MQDYFELDILFRHLSMVEDCLLFARCFFFSVLLCSCVVVSFTISHIESDDKLELEHSYG